MHRFQTTLNPSHCQKFRYLSSCQPLAQVTNAPGLGENTSEAKKYATKPRSASWRIRVSIAPARQRVLARLFDGPQLVLSPVGSPGDDTHVLGSVESGIVGDSARGLIHHHVVGAGGFEGPKLRVVVGL